MAEPKPIPEGKKEEKKEKQNAPQEQPTIDPYWAWVLTNEMKDVNDVGAWAQEDGLIVLPTNRVGKILTQTSLFFPDAVLDKLIALREKRDTARKQEK